MAGTDPFEITDAIERPEVVLLHADLPLLPRDDVRTDLEVLAECVASWRPGERHALRVVFPIAARRELEAYRRWSRLP